MEMKEETMTKEELNKIILKQEKERRILEMLKYDMPLSRNLTVKDVSKLMFTIVFVAVIIYLFIRG